MDNGRFDAMTPMLIPLEGHGPRGEFEGGSLLLPILDSSLILLLILLAGLAIFFWRRHVRLPMPTVAARRPPEDEAKRILADRFARGDIDTDDFMERASILNWSPGSYVSPVSQGRKKWR